MTIRDTFHAKSPYAGHDCAAHPGDLQGWNSDKAVFAALIDEIRPRIIIEVGTWKGASAIHMGKLAAERGLQTEIICVDTWLGTGETVYDEPSMRRLNGYPQVYYTFLTNVIEAGLQDRITPLPLTSEHAARFLAHKGISAELVYIDADHCREGVSRDIACYWPLVAPGGAMLGDDYDRQHPDLVAAVQKHFEAGMIHEVDGKFLVSK